MASRSATVAGFVMGIMLIPFISSLSDDALKAVPRPLRDGSLALGANKSETILKVLLPAAPWHHGRDLVGDQPGDW